MSKKFLSFSFPETTKKQIDAMPVEMQLKFYKAVTDYGMYGIEPEDLSDMERLIWIPMADLLDNGKESRGGAPAGNKNAQKNNVDFEKTTETTQNNQNNVDFDETTQTTFQNVNVNVNPNVNENGKDNGGLATFGSPPQEDFSQKAFEIFKNAGLPCCEGNYLSFLQRDFKLAIPYLRGYSTREALEACQNYASIFQKSSTDAFWLKQRVAFDKFCERKIRDFLPGNFVPEKYDKETREDRRGL